MSVPALFTECVDTILKTYSKELGELFRRKPKNHSDMGRINTTSCVRIVCISYLLYCVYGWRKHIEIICNFALCETLSPQKEKKEAAGKWMVQMEK